MEFTMNVARNVEQASLYFPEKPALIFEGQTYTNEELNKQVNRLANAIKALGVKKGDRVALFLPNIPAFIICYFAAQKLGAIAVSINAMSKKKEVQYMVSDSGCEMLFTTSALREEVPADELPTLKQIIIAEGEAGNDLDFNGLMVKADANFRCSDMEPGDPAAILYTSGTTGFPKGAVLTQMNIVSNSNSSANHSGVSPEDRGCCSCPFSTVLARISS
jgi:long-chain acyl-CoA synthetase